MQKHSLRKMYLISGGTETAGDISANLLLYPPHPQTLYSSVLWAAVAKRWGSLSPPELSHWAMVYPGKPAGISHSHQKLYSRQVWLQRTSSPFPSQSHLLVETTPSLCLRILVPQLPLPQLTQCVGGVLHHEARAKR